jgi:hypothetical protein
VWNELKYKCEVHKDYADLPAGPFCVMSAAQTRCFMNLLVKRGRKAIEVRGCHHPCAPRPAGADEGLAGKLRDTGKRAFAPGAFWAHVF